MGGAHPTISLLSTVVEAELLTLLDRSSGGSVSSQALARALRGDDSVNDLFEGPVDRVIKQALRTLSLAGSAAIAGAVLASLPALLYSNGEAPTAKHARAIIHGCARAGSGTGDAGVACAALTVFRATAEVAPTVFENDATIVDAALSAIAAVNLASRSSGALSLPQEVAGGALRYDSLKNDLNINAAAEDAPTTVSGLVRAHAASAAAAIAVAAPKHAANWWAATRDLAGAPVALAESLTILAAAADALAPRRA
jgi:hypothetical protein